MKDLDNWGILALAIGMIGYVLSKNILFLIGRITIFSFIVAYEE